MLLKKTLLATAALSVSLLVTTPAAAVTFILDGQHQGGYGQHGLYLGNGNWDGQHWSTTNWEWTNVMMDLDEVTGDAHIYGTMRRHYDLRRGYDLQWGIDIQLTDMQLTGGGWGGQTQAYAGMVDDVAPNRSIDWGELSLRVDIPDSVENDCNPYCTSVNTEYRGLAMPDMGHPNVAELNWTPHGLEWTAWYKKVDGSWHFKYGDTKADIRPMDPIPEPESALLFLAGAAIVGHRIRRKLQ